MYETHVVPGFGGGLRFDSHPAFIPDDTWSWSDGFFPRLGTAEMAVAYANQSVGPSILAATEYLTDLSAVGSLALYAVIGNTNTTPTTADNTAQIWKLSGGVSKIKWDTTGTAPRSATTEGVGLSMTRMNNVIVASFGSQVGSVDSVVQFTYGDATYTPISPTMSLTPRFLLTANSRLIAARLKGTSSDNISVAWSDANSQTVWDPAISNSADTVVLEDAADGIRGVARRSDGLVAILTNEGQIVLVPTGAIPAFTIQYARTQGCYVYPANPCVSTPYGLCWVGPDDFYLEGQGWGGGLHQYFYRNAISTTVTYPVPSLQWHPGLRCVIVPCQNDVTIGGATYREFLFGDPVTKTWARRTIANTAAEHWRRHVVYELQHYVASDTLRLWAESTSNTPHTGAFVDTKDFAFDLPMAQDYVDRIKVDVEPLTNASTDAITISAAVHNDLSRQSAGVLGSLGFETQNLTFTSLGTVTGGVSELPVRLRGKYIRFRFTQSSGRVRIRGFSIRRQRASDKKVS